MCAANKKLFIVLFICALLSGVEAVLRAEEPWYLISETELRSIETYKAKSEAEKRNWLLQAQTLKAASENLNAQLAKAREQNLRLEQSYNESEAEWLMRLSLKNGEIAALKKTAADQALETEKYKRTAIISLIFIAALVAVSLFKFAVKVCRFFRVIP
jgi:hypothetical protein